MNSVNPKKLLHSKWTAVQPHKKQKHFLITAVDVDEDQKITRCVIEAVMTKREHCIEWRDLKDNKKWLIGWQ